MEHAWLHSLSEDWISQHPSSGSPAPSLGNSVSSSTRTASSRIPKYNSQKQAWAAPNEGGNSPLSERSLNEYNIPLSQRSLRQPSKLREVTMGGRGRHLSRALSASSTQSVQHNTVQHKSHSLSPKKETPEWKRRLLQGEVAYGEAKDLFSAAGLETIFQPPPETSNSPNKLPAREVDDDGSVAMPSSPPPYDFGRVNSGNEDNDEDNFQRHQQPRGVKYRLAESDGSEFSINDLSRGSSFQLTARSVRGSEDVGHQSEAASEMDSSVLQHRNGVNGAGRTTSGQSDVRNEELSPIYISRHNTIDGRIDYAASNIPADELQRRLENIREESPAQFDDDQDGVSEQLPANMTVETDDYAHNGRFVNLRRGGHSQEGSFQKRMLSPSSLPAIDESAMLPEESMQASTPKQLPNIKKTRSSNEYQQASRIQGSPPVPQTPYTSPSKPTQKEQQSSSGSPLKLFGTYDTFTNQKLLRRLSQFEGDFEEANGQESTHPEMNDAFVAQSSAVKPSQDNGAHEHTSRKLTSFGRGDLDGFQFSEEVSYASSGSNGEDEDKENMSLPLLNPDTQHAFRFHLEPSPALEDDVVSTNRTRFTSTTRTSKHIISVRKTRPGTSSSDFSTDMHPSQQQEDLQTPRKRTGDSEGKRLQRTPLKDPTPKRRRTLQNVDTEEDESLALDSLRETHQQMQSVIGRKRKDARHGDNQQAANPKVLAMRQILRPRTPTPSQRSSQTERPPLAEMDPLFDRARILQQEKIAKIQAELDSTNHLKMSAVLGMSQQMQNDSRKGSVTTQDFLDEAKKIMAGIRDKVRPRSGLTSLEESESENDKNQSPGLDHPEDEFEDSYQESTKEPFSRPPSREGKPIARLPREQEDPKLLDHLRKYQEMSEVDGLIASSMKSLALAKEASNVAKEADRVTDETISRASGRFLSQEIVTESDPPNVRLSENPDLQRKRKHSISSIPSAGEVAEAEFPSHGSNSSSGQSTSRSIPTGSSRGSDSRRVIPPHTVSHLIPEQVAGMVFDRERNIWVKRKSVSGESRGQNFLPSDETEDDPFGDIPDLSVDETQERQRIKAVDAKRKEEARVAQEHHEEEERKAAIHSQRMSRELRDSIAPSATDRNPSSEPSNLTHLRSSVTTAEPATRLTSRGEEHNTVSSQVHSRTGTVKEQHRIERTEIREEIVEEVEKEISILEDRVDPTTPRRRNVTITFSSPVASVIKPNNYENEDSYQSEEDGRSESDDEASNASVLVTKNHSRKASTTMRSAMRSASRLQSLRGHTFSTRPVSRIDERDEDSAIRNDEARDRSSISIVVSAPLPARREASMILATPRPSHEVGTLTLTPLSDFTVHHGDQSLGLDVSYVAQNQRYVMGTETKKALSYSIKQLVEKLTEVEPYEPFWEHLKKLELKNKGLTNLHKLNEFCEELEELDVSHNQLGQLDGIPRTVRHLSITHNCLTELTAWAHLGNLQYINVSNNELESLSALKLLVHLRGLTADNNNITSLDGVSQLDGLLSLRLRGNSIQSCDFGGTKLQRLTELDLAGNRIRNVYSVQELQSLSSLNLEDNCLSGMSIDGSDALWALSDLRLSGNNLITLDVARFPNLRLLYLDRNRLGTVTGLLKTKVDSLSMREQQDGFALDLSFLSQVFEVRKLFLSGNYLGTFDPQVEFMNLQCLELANCGLNSLPSNFGLMVANTRTLNLNFNALKDLKPLLGIRRLKKLHLAGNRILRLRTTARVLGHFPSLTLTDMRGNPLTVGWYPPMEETRMILSGVEHNAEPQDPFVLGMADRERDEKYVQRLDMQTRMLRRTFEILVLGDCPRLRVFDGLDVDMSVVIRKDSTWQALVNAGVLKTPALEGPEPEEQKKDVASSEAVQEEQSVSRSVKTSTETSVETFMEKCVRTSVEERIGKSVETRIESSAKNSAQKAIEERHPIEKPVQNPKEEELWPAEDSFA
ncbi:related to CYR1 Adenylate cyclase [Phialocephala subalpina]|uniref:Related to CYR1 Adenylate cyclase n=1 Tax=Phialocephala subalpina TaxID=576137 RepID=A0A1L7WGR2_9HELO|nr:related to CYR1 Adenylate cyclase [Phialocephala subalpina]